MRDLAPNERRCPEAAKVEVFWPGRPALLCCEPHAASAQRIGEVMGCYISVRAYSGTGGCEQIIRTEGA